MIAGLRARLNNPVVQFGLAALAAVLVVGAAAAYLLDRVANDEGIEDAKRLTALAAQGIVEPNLDRQLLEGDPEAVRELDELVSRRVLTDNGIVRLKIWNHDGRIVYSDEHRLIGTGGGLGDEEKDVLDEGGVVAEEADLSDTENRYERGFGELLEVYMPVRGPDGSRLLLETYIKESFVASVSSRVSSTVSPVMIGALLLLAALQLPLAVSLARRLRSGQREREALLQRAIDASEHERRRIAQDLHDGVVQDLAGVAFSVAAAAERNGRSPETSPDILDQTAARLRETVRDLRGLLVEIYPPDLHREGLAAAISDITAGLEKRGINASVEVPPGLLLEPHVERLFFRVAQEAVRNVVAHSAASAVTIRVNARPDGARSIEVSDNGRGFDPATAPVSGHFGLRMIADMAQDCSASVDVDSAPGTGTRIAVEVKP